MENNFQKGGTAIIVVISFLVVASILTSVYFYLNRQLTDVSTISEAPEEEKLAETEVLTGEQPQEDLCQNKCPRFGEGECVNKESYHICSYDAQNCRKWSPAISCLEGTECQDGNCVKVFSEPEPKEPTKIIQCNSGPCCNLATQQFRSASYICHSKARIEYSCPWGNQAGSNVGVRYQNRYCSGSSAGCEGELKWSNWALHKTCSANEKCEDGACVQEECPDGTPCGECSTDKPKYCDNGNLIEKCSSCGCSSGLICKKNICVDKEKNSVALFVDGNTYQALSNEIVRFGLDIERDVGVNVFVFHDNWSRAKEIRDELIDLREIGIKGAILIGDMPITYQITEYQGRRYPPTPSDYYYQKLDQKDWFEETADTIVQTIGQKSNYSRTIWTSRLMAPGNNFNQKIELLKNYFDRNHKYRIGQLSYSGMLFLESQDQSNISEELNSTVGQIAEYTSLYKESSKVETAYAFDPGERKDRILEKLTKNYEIISFNIHGSPTSQWVGGNYYINKEDILNHPPGALFISLESCSNGDIRNSNYIAGWYLFSGKSLLVRANSVETFYIGWGSLDSLIEYKLVATGIDFGEIYKNCTGGQQSFLFGDPTLSIRKKDFENGPKLAIDESIIDLGNISINDIRDSDVLKSIKIKNNGKSKLILTCYSFGYSWMDRSSEEEDYPSGALQIEPIAETKTISSGASVNISIVAQDKKYIVPGRYRQFETYITNDPSNPYLKIDLNCTWYK